MKIIKIIIPLLIESEGDAAFWFNGFISLSSKIELTHDKLVGFWKKLVV